ncbi:MAG: SPOR domain-containing protein [Robiginitomaculum sp.]
MENEPQDAYLPDRETEALEPFDVRAQSSHRGMWMLVGGFLFLLLLAAIIMGLFSGGVRDKDQTPRILADNEPYKEAPANHVTTAEPEQELEIYDVQAGNVYEKAVTVAPTSEKPIEFPKPKPVKPKANIVIKAPKVDVKPTAQPMAQPTPSTPVTTHRTPGNYVVQIAALRSNADAQALWGKIKIKHSAIIRGSYFADIKRVNRGEKGIYYRLRIGGLADKMAAKSLCTQLKTNKQDCLVTKK